MSLGRMLLTSVLVTEKLSLTSQGHALDIQPTIELTSHIVPPPFNI